MINFSTGAGQYQAESGMTWAQWCDSEYNIDRDEGSYLNGKYYIEDNKVLRHLTLDWDTYEYTVIYNDVEVSPNDMILADVYYSENMEEL